MKAALAAATLLVASSARAQDRFELAVYDAETTPPGETGVDVHVNFVVRGTLADEPSGELATHHMTRFTLEPAAGLNRFLELGAYVQTALRGDGRLDFAGLKLRLKARVPHRFAAGVIGLAANLEFSSVPPQYESGRYAFELRPILDLAWRRLHVSVNPIVGIDLAGARAGRVQLEPCAKASLSIVPTVSLGVEYYAGLGPIDAPDPGSAQTHRLFGVIDFDLPVGRSSAIDLDLGAGYGFAGSTDGWTIKLIAGISGR